MKWHWIAYAGLFQERMCLGGYGTIWWCMFRLSSFSSQKLFDRDQKPGADYFILIDIGLGCIWDGLEVQSPEFRSVKKNQEAVTVGERKKTSSRSGNHEIKCWYGKAFGFIEIWTCEYSCFYQRGKVSAHIFVHLYLSDEMFALLYLLCIWLSSWSDLVYYIAQFSNTLIL